MHCGGPQTTCPKSPWLIVLTRAPRWGLRGCQKREVCVCVCVCVRLSLPVCVHAREGRGAPRSSLAAAPNLIPSEGLARCGMRARRRRCQLCKSSSTPGNKKSETCKDEEGAPAPTFPRLGPAGAGREGEDPSPRYPARDLGCGRAGAGRGVDTAAPVAPPP